MFLGRSILAFNGVHGDPYSILRSKRIIPECKRDDARPLFRRCVSMVNAAVAPKFQVQQKKSVSQARFIRDFVGKTFSARLPLGSITEFMSKGSFHVDFGGNGWGGDVRCKFSDQSDVAKITEMNKGDMVNIRGVIDDHSFGTIDLRECSVN